MGHNSASLEDNCMLFAPTPYFWAQAIRWCRLNFSLATSVAMAMKFGTTRSV